MSTIEAQIARAEERWRSARVQHETVKREIEKHKEGLALDWLKLDDRHRLRRRMTRMGEYEAAEQLVDGDVAAANVLERVIGPNQLFGIDFFERGLIAARSVARVEIRGFDQRLQGYGSGVLISPRLFLTNNHVLPDEETAAGSRAQFEYLTTATGMVREPLLFNMRPDKFFITSERLDISIVALEDVNGAGQPLSLRGWCPLIPGSGKAIKGERVNIIQHPSGERMQVTVRDNTIMAVEGDFLQYQADTKAGSSGAPVFNDQWEMAALHHAGVPKRDPTGRILMRDGKPWTGRREDEDEIDWMSNEGVRISSLVDHVNKDYVDKARLTPEQVLLWKACLEPPHPLELWDLFALADRQPESSASQAQGPFVQEGANGGQVSWLFRLSFGPVGAPGLVTKSPGLGRAAPPPVLVGPPPVSPRLPGTPPVPRGAGNLDAHAMAEQVVARFRPEGPYYDKAKDAEAAEAYWDGVDWEAQPRTLFARLRRHLEATYTKRHSYVEARHKFLYPAVDLHEDGKLRNIYSGTVLDPAEAIAAELALILPRLESHGFEASGAGFERMLASDELFDEAEEAGGAFNCEHVVPQSWFDKDEPMRSDLHHLFACEPGCNSFRGNTPYWQFPRGEEVERDLCGRREPSKFEPEHGKGPVARATLYFLLRYPGVIGDRNQELSGDRLSVLLGWHRDHPVTDYERHRNALIQEAQGNRNPFIDRPAVATEALLKQGFGRSR
jgi:endonuclease G